MWALPRPGPCGRKNGDTRVNQVFWPLPRTGSYDRKNAGAGQKPTLVPRLMRMMAILVFIIMIMIMIMIIMVSNGSHQPGRRPLAYSAATCPLYTWTNPNGAASRARLLANQQGAGYPS
jgi:hypothetical protein